MSAEHQIKVYQDDITPFLQRLPAFLLFPFQPAPLIVIAGLSLASIITVFSFGLFRGLIGLFFLRYAYAVMELASMGKLIPKWDDISIWGNKDKRPYKQNLVFFLYFILVLVAANLAIKPDPALATKTKAPLLKPANAALPVPSSMTASSSQHDMSDDNDADTADTDEPKTLSQYDMAAPGPSDKMMTDAANATGVDSERSSGSSRDRARYGATENVTEDDNVSEKPGLFARVLDPNVHFSKWFYLLVLLFAIPLPAAVMVLAIEDNLFRALNPATSLFFIRGMGASYFVVWLLFGLVLLAGLGVRHLMPATLPQLVSVPLQMFLNFYLILATYSMMGYVLYQYHQQLGLDVLVDFDSHRAQASAAPESTDPFIRRVEDLLAKGEIDVAIRLIEDEMRYDRFNVDLNERLYQLMQRKGVEAKIIEQGNRYLIALCKAEKNEKAMHMLDELKKRAPDFEVSADHVLLLAKTAFAAHKYGRAMTMIQGFDKKNPQHGDIPGVYLLAARLANEHFRKQAQAISILQVLLKRYPESALSSEASAYLENLQRSLASSPAVTPPAG
ncbi:tetratricopeptide repeat protein [Undibacterium sp. TJN19]|uniref:tetratricopeptide repeat protein n=1 Tax=Undibacterium sp. TJN19 TaxID=3413055 RepID=UPI003BF3FC4D